MKCELEIKKKDPTQSLTNVNTLIFINGKEAEFGKLTKMRTLREETGRGLMRCKEALQLHNWDMEKAREYLLHNYHILIDWGKGEKQ